jgi:hypothetical protein
MRYIISLLGLFLISGICDAQTYNPTQITNATCHIRILPKDKDSKKQAASGVFVGLNRGRYYIATCGHGVDKAKEVYVRVFWKGRRSFLFPAKVEYSENAGDADRFKDFSILSIEAAYFAQQPPVVIPLYLEAKEFIYDTYIKGAGCPGGRDVISWQGRIIKDIGDAFFLTPGVLPGESGSPICLDINNQTYVVGIVTRRADDRQSSLGIEVQQYSTKIREIIYGSKKNNGRQRSQRRYRFKIRELPSRTLGNR